MNKILYIVAATAKEYEYWIRELKLDRRRTFYLSQSCDLHGLRNIEYLLVGRWWLSHILDKDEYKFFKLDNKQIKENELDEFKKDQTK